MANHEMSEILVGLRRVAVRRARRVRALVCGAVTGAALLAHTLVHDDDPRERRR